MMPTELLRWLSLYVCFLLLFKPSLPVPLLAVSRILVIESAFSSLLFPSPAGQEFTQLTGESLIQWESS